MEYLLNALNDQSRHLIVTILSDQERSPFLKLLQSSRSSEIVASSITRSLTRCMQVLLASSSDVTETRTFMIQCFINTPKLFIAYFHTLSIPEVSPSFSCISSYAFVTHLIEKGPIVLCENMIDLNAENLVLQIVPRGFTKNILTKTLQTSNSVLVVECLKCMSAIIKRLNKHIAHVRAFSESRDTIEKLVNAVCKRLPDLQVLLSLRSKFDPFCDNQLSKPHANMIVSMHFCDVLQLYASTFTSTISSLPFDWTKLLPDDCLKGFCSVESCLQIRLLTTLASIYSSYQVSTKCTIICIMYALLSSTFVLINCR